jgi:hypothetical protein
LAGVQMKILRLRYNFCSLHKTKQMTYVVVPTPV